MTAEKGFILAAGGLLERATASGPAIAVVGRNRYADRSGKPGDWVLPKGKVEPHESLERAALREVLEETGCTARIVGPSFECEYVAAGRPKLVTFFRMQLQTEGAVRDAAEVSSVRWLSPREALQCLTYETERDVVRRAFPGMETEEGR